ncbi:MAG: PAS domain S-box protein, partial [Chitinophagaceae bacterium]
MSLQELKKKETLEVDALKEKAVTIFLQSSFHKLSGTWSWDMESEAVFCSDVILSLPINFIGTKGIFHPDDVEAVKEKIAGGQSFLHHLEFRFITTYGQVQTLSGQDIAIEIADDDVSNCVQQLADLEARDRKEKGEHRHLQLLHEIYLQSERFFNGGIWYYNRATTQTWYSDYIFRLHGLPPQSLNAHLHTFNEFIHPEDRDLVVDYVEKAFQEASPLYFEYRIITANSEKYLAYKSQWFYSEKGEAILYGTLQDVTEQKSAEQETAAYKDLSHFQKQQLVFNEQHVSIGHWQIDLLTRKSVYSDNYYRIFGLKPGTASPHINSFINFIHPDDQELVAASHKKMIYEHAAPDLEFRVLRADGKTRYISQKAKLVMHNGNMIISGIIQDVTVQRLLEKKVGELNEQALVQRQQLMQVDEIGSTGSWFVDLQTGTTTWSDNFYKLLGYKTQLPELSQRTLLSMVHPQDVKKFKEAWNTVLEQKQEAIFQFRLLLRGAERHMKAVMRIHLVKDKEFFIGTLQDITLENVLQQQLASRMQLAESLTENILDRIIVTDVNNTVVLWNKACETAYGVKKEAAIGQNFFDLFPQRKTEEETQAIYQVLRGEKVVMEASRSHWGPGYYDVNMMPLYTADEVSGIMRIVHDVTKETELRIDLRGRLNFIEKLLESSVDRIVALDRNLNYQYWNSKAEEYYGIPKKKVIGKNVLEVFPQIRNDPSFTEFRRALTGETVHISANFEQGKYFETYLIPILSDKDETTGVLWIAHDLTKEMAMQEEQRKAQTLLEQEHQRLKEAQAIGRVGSFEWSVGSRVSYWSDELYRINGLSPQSEEITLEKVDRFVHPDDRALLDQVKKESMQKPGSYNHVHRIIRKDGEVRWVNHAWESLADEENRVQKVIGIVQDITEQKKAEDELKESQLFTEKVMDATPDFIFVFNLVTGKNEFVNQSAYKGDAVRY